MTTQSSTKQGDAAFNHARDVLWTKLLAGEVTEVYVPGVDFYEHLPQTLGLEPIFYQPYKYDRDGVPRDANQLSEIASQLSAEPWWIAGGGPWFWGSHFAERAEAALIFHTALDGPVPPAPQNTISIEAGVRWLYRRWRDRRNPDADGSEDYWQSPNATAGSLAEAMVVRRPQLASVAAIQFLIENHPEKTFVIRKREDLRALRKVRAKRPSAGQDRPSP